MRFGHFETEKYIEIQKMLEGAGRIRAMQQKKDKYRILDGAHRWSMYKKTGAFEIEVVIIILDQIEPILYADKMAIGSRQLTEAETRNTARRTFQSNPRLTASEIGSGLSKTDYLAFLERFLRFLKQIARKDARLTSWIPHSCRIPDPQ